MIDLMACFDPPSSTKQTQFLLIFLGIIKHHVMSVSLAKSVSDPTPSFLKYDIQN